MKITKNSILQTASVDSTEFSSGKLNWLLFVTPRRNKFGRLARLKSLGKCEQRPGSNQQRNADRTRLNFIWEISISLLTIICQRVGLVCLFFTLLCNQLFVRFSGMLYVKQTLRTKLIHLEDALKLPLIAHWYSISVYNLRCNSITSSALHFQFFLSQNRKLSLCMSRGLRSTC